MWDALFAFDFSRGRETEGGGALVRRARHCAARAWRNDGRVRVRRTIGALSEEPGRTRYHVCPVPALHYRIPARNSSHDRRFQHGAPIDVNLTHEAILSRVLFAQAAQALLKAWRLCGASAFWNCDLRCV